MDIILTADSIARPAFLIVPMVALLFADMRIEFLGLAFKLPPPFYSSSTRFELAQLKHSVIAEIELFLLKI
jgi:hypothetical protein